MIIRIAVFLFFSLLFVGLPNYFYFKKRSARQKLRKEGKKTAGIVVDDYNHLLMKVGGNSYVQKILVTFATESGQKVTASLTKRSWLPMFYFKKPPEVTIYYNPQKPDNAIIGEEPPFAIFLLLMLSGFILFLFFMILLVSLGIDLNDHAFFKPIINAFLNSFEFLDSLKP